MEKIFDILYRLARLLSGVRPDTAAMLFAALHPPGILTGFLMWIAEGLIMDLLKYLLFSPLFFYVWSKLTPEERRRLIALRDRFLTPNGPDTSDDG